MNSENQKTIIQIFGVCLGLTLCGVIIMAILGTPLEVITIFTGIFTAIFTALATFLQGKNMTEKQEETLEKYTLKEALEEETTVTCDNGDGDVQRNNEEEETN